MVINSAPKQLKPQKVTHLRQQGLKRKTNRWTRRKNTSKDATTTDDGDGDGDDDPMEHHRYNQCEPATTMR